MNENLRALIASTGESMFQLGVQTGIHPSALSKYLHGHRPIGDAHAGVLATYFAVTPAQVRGLEEIPYERLVRVRELPAATDA